MILDNYNYRVYIKGKIIELTYFETLLLEILIKNKDRITFLSDFYSESYNATRLMICRLNKKLYPYAKIVNKPKKGYYLMIQD